MTRFAALALLCLACGGNSPELVDYGDDDSGGSAGMPGAGGSAGSGVVTGGDGGMGAAETGGASGMASGGAQATGGALTGGTGTGGVFPMGGTSTGGTVATGGAAPTGGSGAVPQGGVGPTGGSGGRAAGGSGGGAGGSAGRLLWTHDFSYDGTLAVGSFARHELRIFLNYPSDMATPCLVIGQDNVPHGMTGSSVIEVGGPLKNCLGAVPTTSLSRHTFNLRAEGSSAVVTGGGNFELPADSRSWNPRVVVRTITTNTWNAGAVVVRETWEIRE